MSHSVYRLYTDRGVLLYVGRTKDFTARLRQHRKPWTPGGQVWSYQFHDLIALYDVESGMTKVEASRREAEVIAAEVPVFNRWRPRPHPCGPLASRWPNFEKAPHLMKAAS